MANAPRRLIIETQTFGSKPSARVLLDELAATKLELTLQHAAFLGPRPLPAIPAHRI